jgi:Family of unknown function (DUF5996)
MIASPTCVPERSSCRPQLQACILIVSPLCRPIDARDTDMPNHSSASWPDLPYGAWRETRDTLQLWTQIIGKVRLMQTPWLNHSWHVTLYVTSRGLTTSPIPHGSRSFEVAFDFIDHVLDIRVSDGGTRRLPLRPQSVADFYAAVTAALAELDVAVVINDKPCEIAGATAFSIDRQHAAYDAEYAWRFWQLLVQVDRVLKRFRTAFIGKCSPVHFFWGSFDLAVTRFAGPRAPAFTGKAPGVAAEVMREAYSHEVSSAGFWPGDNNTNYPAFYSYMYPATAGFREAAVQPAAAFFSETLGEFLLPYDAVRTAADPDATLLAFLQSTYEAAAVTAKWDRAALECRMGLPDVPRDV